MDQNGMEFLSLLCYELHLHSIEPFPCHRLKEGMASKLSFIVCFR